MNFLDLVIILVIAFGFFIGFKRGVTKEAVCFAKFAFSLVVAFIFKNPLSRLMYENLPFFKFGGYFKGVSAINILFYEFLAFLLILLALMIIFRLLMLFTSIFEKILESTIILGIPSKILGFFIGGIHYYFVIFVVLFVLSLPMLGNNKILNGSLFTPIILKKTPILSMGVKSTVNVIDEFYDLKEEYDGTSTNKFNLDTMDLFLKYDIIKVDSAEYLVKKKKLNIKGIDEVIEKYKK